MESRKIVAPRFVVLASRSALWPAPQEFVVVPALRINPRAGPRKDRHPSRLCDWVTHPQGE